MNGGLYNLPRAVLLMHLSSSVKSRFQYCLVPSDSVQECLVAVIELDVKKKTGHHQLADSVGYTDRCSRREGFKRHGSTSDVQEISRYPAAPMVPDTRNKAWLGQLSPWRPGDQQSIAQSGALPANVKCLLALSADMEGVFREKPCFIMTEQFRFT